MGIQKRLSAGEFVVVAEMSPPKGVDISRFITAAQRIRGRVDAVSVPCMEGGIMRMSAIGGGVLLQQQGLEALVHVYTRDRNRLALQGDLLAAHVLGLRNLLVVDSEDIALGDHRDARPVNDLSELGLMRAIGTLQDGKDLAGIDLAGVPTFFTGCRLRRFENDEERKQAVDAAAAQVEAGAQFIVTPPVFEPGRAQPLFEALAPLGAPVLATVFLIKSVAVARYIATHEPAAGISEDLIRRIRKSPDRGAECLRIAGELVAALRSTCQGVLIQTTGWEHRLPTLLDAAGI